MKKTITLRVFRFDPLRDEKFRFENFSVPLREGLTLQEALFYILDELDPCLAFNYGCGSADCGSCALHINGRYRLACQTQIAELRSSKITVRPLAHLPLIKDLAVDMTPFFEKIKLIKPYLEGGTEAVSGEYLQNREQRKKIETFIDCILCGACYSSCLMTLTNEDYLGPAALMKAARFIEDSRDRAGKERLKIVASEDGLWRCHQIGNCAKVCPRSLSPVEAISRLRRKAVLDKFKYTLKYRGDTPGNSGNTGVTPRGTPEKTTRLNKQCLKSPFIAWSCRVV